MKRQLALFLIAFSLIALLGLTYIPLAGVDLGRLLPTATESFGTNLVLRPAQGCSCDKFEMRHAERVLTRRLDRIEMGQSYQIMMQEEPPQFEIKMSDVDDMPYLINVITHVGEVEFVDGGAAPALGQTVNTSAQPHTVRDQPQFDTLFTDQDISAVIPPDAESGEIFYQITLQPEAAQRFGEFHQAGSGHYVCLVLDSTVTNCSNMYHWRGTTLDILPHLSGGLGLSLADLEIFLDSGPLPFPLDVDN